VSIGQVEARVACLLDEPFFIVRFIMKTLNWLGAAALLNVVLLASGCVVHDRTVVREPGPGYAAGYQEGYYDREHNRYWHDQAWADCVANDPHCH
jgi:hypothetical protein